VTMTIYCLKNLENLKRQREWPRNVAQTFKAKIMKDSEKAAEYARKAREAAERAEKIAKEAAKNEKKRR